MGTMGSEEPAWGLCDICLYLLCVWCMRVSPFFLALTLTWICLPLSQSQTSGTTFTSTVARQQAEGERASECVRKRGKRWQRKNSCVVAKRRGEIWARWLNCISQIACHSRSTGAAFDLIQLIVQPRAWTGVLFYENWVSVRISQLQTIP